MTGRSDGTGRPRSALARRDGRLIVLQVLVIALIGTLFLRLAWMQLGGTTTFRNASASNSVREIVTPAQRGLILDQVGRPLVGNRSSIAVTVDRAALTRQRDRGTAVLARLASQLGTTPEAISDRLKSCGTPGAPAQPLCWNGPSAQPAVVADDVPQAVGLQLMEAADTLPAVRTELAPVRAYPRPYGVNVAHVAGYLGQITGEEQAKIDPTDRPTANQLIGRAGLEKQYDSVLAGTNGMQRVAVSRSGQINGTVEDTAAIPGQNIVTNIDARLQAVTEQQLAAAIDLAHQQGKPGDSGAIAVLDSTNGRVLSMASYPTYDPNIWTGGIDSAKYAALNDPNGGLPLLNRAIQGVYPPASTFKVVSAVAAMKAGFTTTASYPCPSEYSIGGQRFANYESHSYGMITLSKALSVSCDTVFYKLAHSMWLSDGGLTPDGKASELMLNTAKGFGLGKATGLDLPGEYAGRLVGRADKKAIYAERKDAYCKRAADGYPEVTPEDRAKLLQAYARDFCESGDQFRAGDALNLAIGQGDTGVTPVQIATLYSAIGNGGTLWHPQLVRAVVAKDGTVGQRIEPASAGRLDVPSGALGYLQSALADTSVNGTTAGVFAGFPLNKISVAAKTGTGEVAGKASTAWLASFAPATSAKYTVVCVVSQGGTGAGTCGPSVRRIYEALFGITGSTVDPSKSVLKGGEPSDSIPKVSSDGVGQLATAVAPPAKASPKATKSASPMSSPSPSATTSKAPAAGESAAAVVSPTPTPSGDVPAGEAPAGIVSTPGPRSSRSRSP
ncbi:MAG: penicillin-binding protein 2 [Actinomycetes bacterium]